MFYFAIKENTVLNGICEEREALELSLKANGFSDYEILSTELDIDNNTDNRYIFDLDKKEWILNPNYEKEQEAKERERIQELFMTRSDFFDGTIQAWGVGQDELLILVQGLLATLPLEDVKKLIARNNFKNALNFYRKHDLFKMLVNTPIPLGENIQVVITDKHLDRFFDEVDKGNKETAWQYLPSPVMIPVEVEDATESNTTNEPTDISV